MGALIGMSRFAGMSFEAMELLLDGHVPLNEQTGSGPWARCTLCLTWDTVTQDTIDQIAQMAEGSEWLCCICAKVRKDLAEQGVDTMERVADKEPAKPAYQDGCGLASLCNDGTPGCPAQNWALGSLDDGRLGKQHAPPCRRSDDETYEDSVVAQRVACGQDSPMQVLRSFYSGPVAGGLVEDEDTGFMSHDVQNQLNFQALVTTQVPACDARWRGHLTVLHMVLDKSTIDNKPTFAAMDIL